MATEAVDLARLADAVEALRREVGRLSDRVAALESAARPAAAAPRAAADGLSEELVLVISAAIAAYLGKKPHIRQIRLLRSDAWAQQGRATVQASHVPKAPTTRSAP